MNNRLINLYRLLITIVVLPLAALSARAEVTRDIWDLYAKIPDYKEYYKNDPNNNWKFYQNGDLSPALYVAVEEAKQTAAAVALHAPARNGLYIVSFPYQNGAFYYFGTQAHIDHVNDFVLRGVPSGSAKPVLYRQNLANNQIWFDGGDNISVESLNFQSSATGRITQGSSATVRFDYTTRVHVYNNVFQNAPNFAVQIYATATNPWAVVEWNLFTHNWGDGCHVSSGSNITITNNTFEDGLDDDAIGVICEKDYQGVLLPQPDTITITNNSITRHIGRGVALLGAKNVTIQYNTIDQTGNHGIEVNDRDERNNNDYGYVALSNKYCANIKIDDNSIYHAGMYQGGRASLYSDRDAIAINFVSSSEVLRNSISYPNRAGIAFGPFNGLTVQSNVVSDFGAFPSNDVAYVAGIVIPYPAPELSVSYGSPMFAVYYSLYCRDNGIANVANNAFSGIKLDLKEPWRNSSSGWPGDIDYRLSSTTVLNNTVTVTPAFSGNLKFISVSSYNGLSIVGNWSATSGFVDYPSAIIYRGTNLIGTASIHDNYPAAVITKDWGT